MISLSRYWEDKKEIDEKAHLNSIFDTLWRLDEVSQSQIGGCTV